LSTIIVFDDCHFLEFILMCYEKALQMQGSVCLRDDYGGRGKRL